KGQSFWSTRRGGDTRRTSIYLGIENSDTKDQQTRLQRGLTITNSRSPDRRWRRISAIGRSCTRSRDTLRARAGCSSRTSTRTLKAADNHRGASDRLWIVHAQSCPERTRRRNLSTWQKLIFVGKREGLAALAMTRILSARCPRKSRLTNRLSSDSNLLAQPSVRGFTR